IAVVARQAFALTPWTPLAAVVAKGADPATLADPWSESEWTALPAGWAGRKRSSQGEPAPCRIRDGAPQDAVLPVAEGLQRAIPGTEAHAAVLLGSWPDRVQSIGWLPLAALGATGAGTAGQRQDAGMTDSLPGVSSDQPGPAALWFAGGSALSFDAARG